MTRTEVTLPKSSLSCSRTIVKTDSPSEKGTAWKRFSKRSRCVSSISSSCISLTVDVEQCYRKRDPINAEETEFMENLFDVLCSALSEPEIKQHFLDSEGVDLMVLMMKYVLFYCLKELETNYV